MHKQTKGGMVITCAALAAIAELLKKQKPMTVLLSAWCPGGRTMATPVDASCLQHANTQRQQLPANGNLAKAQAACPFIRPAGHKAAQTQMTQAAHRHTVLLILY